jgi:hypothetical protein
VDDPEVVMLDAEPEPHPVAASRPARDSGSAPGRQLAYLSSLCAGQQAAPRWVRAAAMGVAEFRCDAGAGGFLMRLFVLDGTRVAVVRAGDALVARLIGMPSGEYARRDKRETRPLRAAMSAHLSRLQGLFLLAPAAAGAGPSGADEAEVLEIDASGGGGAARALLERVEGALAAGMGPMEGPGW